MTASIYDQDAADALADIAEAGAPVVFLADTYRGGSIASDVTAQAVEIPGDPDTYTTLGVVVRNPVTLLIAAYGLSINPVSPGMQFTWAGVTYGVRLATPLAPDGVPILWTVVGAV